MWAHGQGHAVRSGLLRFSSLRRAGSYVWPSRPPLCAAATLFTKSPSFKVGDRGPGTRTKWISSRAALGTQASLSPAHLTLLLGVPGAQGLSWKRRGLQLGIQRSQTRKPVLPVRWWRQGWRPRAVQCSGWWWENLRPRLQNGWLRRSWRALARGCRQGTRGALAGGGHARTCVRKKTSHPTPHFYSPAPARTRRGRFPDIKQGSTS